MHLVLLSHFQLILVKNKDGLPAEVLAQIILEHGFFHRGTSFAPICLLSLQHFVELLLASVQEQLPEVHLCVLRVVKLLEEADAQLDVQVQVGCLRRRLTEDNLHQLEQQRWVIVKPSHQLVLDFVEVVLCDLVKLHS